MKKIIAIIAVLLAASAFLILEPNTGHVFEFTLDPDYRVESASNPIALNYNGVILLLAEKRPGGQQLYKSSNGYVFAETNEYPRDLPGALVLPDGTYRNYFYDPNEGVVFSKSSGDGKYFLADSEPRYYPEKYYSEKAPDTFGVHTAFVDDEGGVVLLYNTTTWNQECDCEEVKVSRAYSEPGDNGENFKFEDDDVLEFYDVPGEQDGFRDPNATVLANGDIYLVVMYEGSKIKAPRAQTGIIFGFISHDGGKTFSLDNDDLLSFDDFADETVFSLNDPKMILGDDGKYHIYVAAMIMGEYENPNYNIVSATSF